MAESKMTRQANKPQTVLVLSGVLFTAGLLAAGFLLPWLKRHDGAEPLRSDLPAGLPLAVHRGNLYLWQDKNHTLCLVPLNGGKIVNLPRPLYPNVVRPSDGLYSVEYSVPNSSTFHEYTIRAANDQRHLRELGVFSPTTPRDGEQRVWHTENIKDGFIRVWRIDRDPGAPRRVPLPAGFDASSARVAGVTAQGLYLLTGPPSRWAEVMTAKNVRTEFPPNRTLIRVPLNGGAPETIASGLNITHVTASDDTVCWQKPRVYPGTTPDTVCRLDDATQITLPHVYDALINDMASGSRILWSLENGIGLGVQLKERRTGDKPRAVEPPLRQTEADILSCERFCRIGRRLYLLCFVTSGSQTSGALPNPDAPQLAPQKHRYLIPLHPHLAGQPGFWGRPITLPDSAENVILDDHSVYFTRKETDQNLGLAIQDVFSSSAPTPTVRTVLYRMPLPE